MKLANYFNAKEISKFLLTATDKKNKKQFKNLPHVFELEVENIIIYCSGSWLRESEELIEVGIFGGKAEKT